jgi:threonine aldolase
MISFTNDYSEGAHPRVLDLLMKSNLEQNTGYGEDVHCDRAKELIKKQLKREDVDIHFIPGGTQTNLLVISSFLRPHQCVIAADSGHINVHETGAIEATGHKVVTVPGVEGKLTIQGIMEALDNHSGEHMVQPKMVYISDTTELGTIYTKAELTAIHELCREKGLILFLDGARMGSALTCRINDLKLEDIARLADVFYIGGTKNGALLGEALVICREDLKEDFRYMIKQRGALMAKGFVIGIQFEALFTEYEAQEGTSEQNLLYYELGSHANRMAEQIANALQKCGYTFLTPVCSNQLFPIMPNHMIASMSKEFKFQEQAKVDENHTAIRFVTSWATTQENVDQLIRFIEN